MTLAVLSGLALVAEHLRPVASPGLVSAYQNPVPRFGRDRVHQSTVTTPIQSRYFIVTDPPSAQKNVMEAIEPLGFVTTM